MTEKLADDTAGIAARLRELEAERDAARAAPPKEDDGFAIPPKPELIELAKDRGIYGQLPPAAFTNNYVHYTAGAEGTLLVPLHILKDAARGDGLVELRVKPPYEGRQRLVVVFPKSREPLRLAAPLKEGELVREGDLIPVAVKGQAEKVESPWSYFDAQKRAARLFQQAPQPSKPPAWLVGLGQPVMERLGYCYDEASGRWYLRLGMGEPSQAQVSETIDRMRRELGHEAFWSAMRQRPIYGC